MRVYLCGTDKSVHGKVVEWRLSGESTAHGGFASGGGAACKNGDKAHLWLWKLVKTFGLNFKTVIGIGELDE